MTYLYEVSTSYDSKLYVIATDFELAVRKFGFHWRDQTKMIFVGYVIENNVVRYTFADPEDDQMTTTFVAKIKKVDLIR